MSYEVTKNRIFQWIGILLLLAVFAGAYWYFSVRASTLNQSQNDLVTNGLVALWSFNGDDISGTTVYDRSGSGNNGTLSGPTKVVGKVGQALSFDGTNDEMTTTTDQGTASTLKTLTLSVWFKTSSASGKKFIGMENTQTGTSSSAYDRPIWIGTDGKVRFGMYTSTAYTATSLTALNDGLWHHAVGVSTGDNGTASLYIDGVLQSSTSIVGTIYTYSSTSYWRIGGFKANWGFDSDGYYTGQLDEVRVYNRALSVTEIQSLYAQGGGTGIGSAVSQAQGSGRLDSGLAGYWKLDETTGSSAADVSTNGNNGTLQNMENGDWVAGQIGNGLDFDGTNEYITTAKTFPASRGTVSAWVNGTMDLDPSRPYMIFEGGTAGNHFNFGINTSAGIDTFIFDLRGAYGTYVSLQAPTYGSSVALQGWKHVVATWDTAQGSAIYINGVLASSTATTTNSFDSFNITIGSATASQTFQGKIDDARVYDRVLSADEVGQLYRLTTPTSVDTSLKGYWSFNGQDISGTTAFDRSGAGNNGTLTGGPTKAIGALGQGLNFDGSNDYVPMSATATADIFTYTAWVKWTTGTNGTVIGTTSGGIQWRVINSSGMGYLNLLAAGVVEIGSSRAIISPGVWTHVALTNDASGNYMFYVNGVDAGGSGTNAYNYTNGTPVIGARYNDTGTEHFTGAIDEVRIYNRALSVTEIKSLYDASAPDKGNSSASQPQGTGRLDSGLAGYWKLDENTGTSVADSSTNGNTGTLTNGPTWTTGQIGSAVTFDGTNDYIDAGNSSSVKPSFPFTVSAWAKLNSLSNTPAIITSSDTGGTGQYTGFIVNVTSSGQVIAQVGGDGFCCDPGYRKTFTTATGVITTGTWYHITAVFTNINNFTIYVNGANQPATSSGTVGVMEYAVNNKLRLGAYYDANTSTTIYTNGLIDEARLYNRALSSDEASQLYRLSAPTGTDTSLKGYWSFNGTDMSGTTAYDRSGSGNHGTLTNGPTKTVGKLGQGLNFDVVDDYVNAGSSASLDNLPAVTASLWIKPNSFGEGNTFGKLIGKDGSVTAGSWQLSLLNGAPCITSGTPTQTASFFFAQSGAAGNHRLSRCSADNSITLNEWQHIAVTWDGATTGANNTGVRLYKNGVEVSYTTTSAAGVDSLGSDASLDLIIGNRPASDRTFDGKIDEVRLYNRVLSPDEIFALYNQSR